MLYIELIGIYMMNKKPKFHFLMLIFIMVISLTACQTENHVEGVCQIDLETGEYLEGCIPANNGDDLDIHAYPLENDPKKSDADAGYPINEGDLTFLLKTWRLTSFVENGKEIKPPFRFLTFYDDGSYAIATEPDLILGEWTTVLRTEYASLLLNPGMENEVQYQIVDLQETELHLRTWQGDVEIDEGYEPDDSGCVCD